jgi:hypothetical protein
MSRSVLILCALAGPTLIVLLSLLSCDKPDSNVSPQKWVSGTLTTDQAKNHIGENGTVCGRVVSKQYAGGSSTRIFLDKDWPKEHFSIVIWAGDWSNFSPRPETWKGKQVCATGLIERYDSSSSDIRVRYPTQINVR